MEFKNWLLESTAGMDQVASDLRDEYPGLELYVWESDHKIELAEIRLPKNMRGQGIGSRVMQTIKAYAASVNKPIVLIPEPDPGKKAALTRFYKRHAFVANKGRNKDFRLSQTFAPTMYWRPPNTSHMP